MTIEIKHPFTSLKGDGGDATLVRPSNWNAVHSTSMNTNKIVGRLTVGVGEFEEIALSTYMSTLLNTASAAALADLLGLFTTGDVKYTFNTVAPVGWLKITASGTIGNAASTGSLLASATASALFIMLYDNCSDGLAPVSGGRTGNALNDFNAGKNIRVPDLVGRVPVAAGSATASTSARTLGSNWGAETHLLLTSEIPSHTHANQFNDANHTHSVPGVANLAGGNNNNGGGGGTFGAVASAAGTTTSTSLTGASITNVAAGGGGTHTNTQPSSALTVMVKL